MAVVPPWTGRGDAGQGTSKGGGDASEGKCGGDAYPASLEDLAEMIFFIGGGIFFGAADSDGGRRLAAARNQGRKIPAGEVLRGIGCWVHVAPLIFAKKTFYFLLLAATCGRVRG
jgi:hypothetical protein